MRILRSSPVFIVVFLLAFGFAWLPAGIPPGQAIQAPEAGPILEGCPVLPANSFWNTPVDELPVHPNSTAYINSIGAGETLHPDFGSGTWNGYPIGIPYNIVPGDQTKVPVQFQYASESDPGPYPIPDNPKIEGNPNSGDRHILILDKDNCVLYELFAAWKDTQGWHAGSGAIYNLNSNLLRPDGWTSADAAGLPILPGLARYPEVASGEINHALRFTINNSRRAYVWPARHYASSLTGSQYPPMGQRFRMKANYDIAGFSPQTQVILRALKKYGMVVADNGSDWYITGAPDPGWDNDQLVSELDQVPGSAFEAVNAALLMVDPDSGEALLGMHGRVVLTLYFRLAP